MQTNLRASSYLFSGRKHLVPIEVKWISTVSHTMINFKHSPDNLMVPITSFKPYCVKYVVSFENCSSSRVKRDQRYITGHLEFNTCPILYEDVLQHKKTVLHQQYHTMFCNDWNVFFSLWPQIQNTSSQDFININMGYLKKGSKYYVKVRARTLPKIFQGTWSEWSETFTFLTPGKNNSLVLLHNLF